MTWFSWRRKSAQAPLTREQVAEIVREVLRESAAALPTLRESGDRNLRQLISGGAKGGGEDVEGR